VRVNVAGATAAQGSVLFGHGRASVVVISFPSSSLVRVWADSVIENFGESARVLFELAGDGR
jgi:hypothetical protein